MPKKILLPTDGSDFSRNAMGQAMAFAKALKATVIGLHVVPAFHMPRDEGDLMPVSTMLKNRVDEEHTARAKQVLDAVEASAKDAGVECQCMVGINDTIHEEIIGTAEKQGCDLIIMASHGHAGMTALLLGSETAKVLTHSKLPVLVLH
jgi:nucleotide-binding universal stress UspA family protein